MPFVDITNIGLSQSMFICIKELSQENILSNLLATQARTFPQSRFISGHGLAAIHLRLPSDVDWFKLSQMLLQQIGTITEIFTFIATNTQIKNGLESVVFGINSKKRKR
jgi:hypothetical protein